jgi:hypothetical protein
VSDATLTLDLAEATWRALLRAVDLLERIAARLAEPLVGELPAPQVTVVPPEVVLPEIVVPPAPAPPVPPAVDLGSALAPLVERIDAVLEELRRSPAARQVLRTGGGGNVRLVDGRGEFVDLPRETGAWSYRSGLLSAGESLSGTGRCVGLWVVPVSTDPVVKVNGGDPVTVPAGGFVLNPRAQLVDPVISCTSGQVRAFLEVLA